jgi:hypothetical protein
MNLSFLDDLFKGIGNVGADADQFMKREMPFDSGWGAPAAILAAIAAPEVIPYFAEAGAEAGGSAGGAEMLSSLGGSGGSFGGDLFQLGGSAGAEGSIGSGGMNSLLSSLGLDGGSGSFAGQEAFQLPMQSYTPDYLNSLANYNGVDAGNPSFLDNLLGNNEQGLYKQEGLAQKASGQTLTDMLKKQAQQKALSQLTQSGSKMQEQNTAQQAEQNRMAQLQAMMRRGQGVDTTTALLSLLQDKGQQSKQPRISLI